MKEQCCVCNLWKIAALLFSMCYLLIINRSLTRVITVTLVLLCIFIVSWYLEYQSVNLMQHVKTKALLYERISLVLTCISLFILLAVNMEEMTSLILVLIITLTRKIKENRAFYTCSFASILLYLLIGEVSAKLVLMSLLTVCGMLISLYFAEKLAYYKDKSFTQREEVTRLNERLKDNERLMKSIRYAAALEERNRMSARLHDKIGHNISGTMLILEASLLQMEKDPQKAMMEVNRAVEHLREGVDDLRHALREERPIKSDINSSDIQLLLDEVRQEHGLHTVLKMDGDLERISMEMWVCIKENVTELITNVLKHSNATVFTVNIKVMPSMIQVVYADNGQCGTTFKKGLGLEAIEERTLQCHGRCFFESGELGFKVTNLFLYNAA